VCELTPWSWVLDKLSVTHLLKNIITLYGSLPCSQQPAIAPILIQMKSIPHHPVCLKSILIISSHLHQSLTSKHRPQETLALLKWTKTGKGTRAESLCQ
jgi:hypothetical protein